MFRVLIEMHGASKKMFSEQRYLLSFFILFPVWMASSSVEELLEGGKSVILLLYLVVESGVDSSTARAPALL